MSRRGVHKPRTPVGDRTDPAGFAALLEAHVAWMQVQHYSEHTIRQRWKGCAYFIAWCQERSLKRPAEVTPVLLERYQRHVYLYRKKNGQPLAARSQCGYLQPLRRFFHWLARKAHLPTNPARDLDLPRDPSRLPKHVLTIQDAEKVLSQPDLATPVGLRDRAILEVLYSTGIRRAEMTKLELSDLDLDRGTLLVREGKGRKDRVVPVGTRAAAWVVKYLAEVRPGLARTTEAPELFLSRFGERIAPGYLTYTVRRYVLASGLGPVGSCHLLRHTAATLMLEGGADIRFIQQLLGHASLATTERYTHVTIRKLQEVHAATHPGAALGRKGAGGRTDGSADPEEEPQGGRGGGEALAGGRGSGEPELPFAPPGRR